MFNQPFYHSLFKKYVVLFGTLFTNIYIDRADSEDNVIARIKVPIQYAPKDKMITRLLSDPELDKQTALILPRMSFELVSPVVRYDPSRKLPSINRWVKKHPDDANKVKYQYNPVPYDLFFSLYVYVKNVEDGLKIVEQIIPFFTPDFTPLVNLIPELNDQRDIPIELSNGPIMTDVYTDDFKTRRMVYWQFDFTMRGFFFGPVKTAPIIKYANTTMLVPISTDHSTHIHTANASPAFRSIFTPGYTGSGPTSNSELSIPVSEIFLDDDFGFVNTMEDLQGGYTGSVGV